MARDSIFITFASCHPFATRRSVSHYFLKWKITGGYQNTKTDQKHQSHPVSVKIGFFIQWLVKNLRAFWGCFHLPRDFKGRELWRLWRHLLGAAKGRIGPTSKWTWVGWRNEFPQRLETSETMRFWDSTTGKTQNMLKLRHYRNEIVGSCLIKRGSSKLKLCVCGNLVLVQTCILETLSWRICCFMTVSRYVFFVIL